MKAKTQIEQAVKAAYDAYAEYARKVDNMPVIPAFPRVSWERGSLKNPNTGWIIDGRLYPGTAEQVITHWDRVRVRWEKKTWRATAEQLPLPDETDTPA